MTRLHYLFLCVVSLNALSQTTVRGTVKNSHNEPVAFCSIGIKDSETGTITSESGDYELTIPENLHNDVVFSAPGYADKAFHKEDLAVNGNVLLEEDDNVLETVVISSVKMKNRTIGTTSRPMFTFSRMFRKDVPTIEQGNIFRIYPKTRIKSYSFHIIPSSKFEQITMKLNIYSVKNNMPDRMLLDENILFKTSGTGWQKVDLTGYDLVFEQLDAVAVTLQLVDYRPLPESEFNFGISAKKALSRNLLFRYQSQGKWEPGDGTFLSNLEISYSKDKNAVSEMDQPEEETASDERLKELFSYYTNKQKAEKTVYGKDKSGKYLDVNDARIYYEEYGKGAPLLLLHGNNGNIADFYQQIPELAKHFHVIAIDTRGQGRSTDLTTTDYTYERFADDLFRLTEELQLKKVNILGWSDGGNTGLVFNIKHPDRVRKLATIGANLNPAGVNDSLLQTFREQLRLGHGNTRLINLMLQHPDIKIEQLQLIQNPVLVIAGSRDVIKEAHTREIGTGIPNAETFFIPDATHYVPFEKPRELNRRLLQFFRK